MTTWPTTAADLEALQLHIAGRWSETPPWRPADLASLAVGAVFLVSSTEPPDRVWAAAVVARGGRAVATAVVPGVPEASYRPGYLALREGGHLEGAVRALTPVPDMVLVNASGRDHPRRAGLALHLGLVLGLPTIGVTDRPLLASPVGDPGPARGDTVPLLLDDDTVGFIVRTRRGARPLCVHAAWRTDAEIARDVVLSVTDRARTPEPLRVARRIARIERARAEGRAPSPGGHE